MSVVYLGTSEFAAAVLGTLAASADQRPWLVLTRPDRPSGRGRRLSSPPVAERARELGLTLAQPDSVNEQAVVETITRGGGDQQPPTVVVCAFGALIKEPLLSAAEIVNVHPSLLPRWRGAAPIERAIMAGDEQTGVSIMRLTAGLDSGPVCLSAAEPIAPHDTYGSLAARLQELAGELLLRALRERPPYVEQDEHGVTYAEKITTEDRLLDPARTAVELERVVRALSPHVGARLLLPGPGGAAVGPAPGGAAAGSAPGGAAAGGAPGGAAAGPAPGGVAAGSAPGGARPPGDGYVLGVRRAALAPDGPPQGTLRAEGERLLLGCAAGALELLEVQPPGGRPMDAAAYLRGHGVPGLR